MLIDTWKFLFYFIFCNYCHPDGHFFDKCYQSLGREKSLVINFVIAGFHRMGSGNTGRERKWKVTWTRIHFIFLFIHVFYLCYTSRDTWSSGKPPFVKMIYSNISDAFLPRFILLKNKQNFRIWGIRCRFFFELWPQCENAIRTTIASQEKKGVSRINRP